MLVIPPLFENVNLNFRAPVNTAAVISDRNLIYMNFYLRPEQWEREVSVCAPVCLVRDKLNLSYGSVRVW